MHKKNLKFVSITEAFAELKNTLEMQSEMNSLKPATTYDRLWDAGRARQIDDWLVGMNGSRAATIRLKNLFSIGRVQTAVLALLVERRKARDAFTPQPYWLVKATFKGEKGTYAFSL